MLKSDPRHYGIFFIVLFIFAVPIVMAAMSISMAFSPASAGRGYGMAIADVAFIVFGIAAYILTNRYSSAPGLSLREGLATISVAMSSGCANLTIVYIFPLLAVVYTIAFFSALLGLLQGKAASQERWQRLVGWFAKHSLHGV